MINEQTLIILGAGASACYGYPTGKELNKNIVKDLTGLYETYGKGSRNIDYRDEELIRFSNSFDASRATLIDYYLAKNPSDSSRRLGKVAIALSLAYAEITNKSKSNFDFYDEDWFSILFDRMTSDILNSNEIDRITENKVSFITFNYDRSLEYFFINALRENYGIIHNGKLQQLLSELEIVHTFGRLPFMREESPLGPEYTYGEKLHPDFLQLSVEQIKTIHEREQELMEVKIEIVKATRIFFLGFGFAEENMRLLNIYQNILRSNVKIYGTAYKWSSEKIGLTKKRIIPADWKKSGNNVIINNAPVLLDVSCKELLSNYL